MKVLVLGVRFYDFVGKEGKKIEFAKVHYVSPDVEDRNTVGLVVSELNVSLETAKKFNLDKFDNVPAFYEFTFETILDYKGLPKAQLTECKLLQNFDVNKILK
ncbi:hypothetical protein [Acetoanaerobium sticklandii]|uniref:hypothetical protein n=1 Tax=Acetoanaerobium sticklandii TaxID=1511 RepID=UPI003A95A58F